MALVCAIFSAAFFATCIFIPTYALITTRLRIHRRKKLRGPGFPVVQKTPTQSVDNREGRSLR